MTLFCKLTNRFGNGLMLTAALGLLPAGAHAQAITLANPSFEFPEIPELPEEPSDLDFVNFQEITGWQKFGPFKVLIPGVVEGTLDTGVFINVPFDPGTGTLISAIPNADQDQLAFMVVEQTASGAETVSILQTTGDVFEAGKGYNFTLGVGSSINTPPGVLTGATSPANAETVELVIGYGGTNGSDITPVATRTVSALELSVDFFNFQVPLTDFTASSGALESTDAAIGQPIQVLVRQVGGESGAFNLDNARLNALSFDLSGDGDVDDEDLGLFFSAFTGPDLSQGPLTNPNADLSGDGDVDDEDLGLVFSAFTGPVAPANVPEPASLALVALCGLALARRRRA